jgi:hypothetical protein
MRSRPNLLGHVKLPVTLDTSVAWLHRAWLLVPPGQLVGGLGSHLPQRDAVQFRALVWLFVLRLRLGCALLPLLEGIPRISATLKYDDDDDDG